MLSHGGGGEEMNSLINETIFKIFDNEILRESNDSAILNFGDFGADEKAGDSANLMPKFNGKLAFSTDSFVATPIFFNGGDIGKIAACGTINDLAMVGAEAKYLSCALIVEEGLELAELERVLGSLAAVARENGVQIVCGDTKVVPRGKCDKIFINTSGIGEIVCEGVELKSLRAGATVHGALRQRPGRRARGHDRGHPLLRRGGCAHGRREFHHALRAVVDHGEHVVAVREARAQAIVLTAQRMNHGTKVEFAEIPFFSGFLHRNFFAL